MTCSVRKVFTLLGFFFPQEVLVFLKPTGNGLNVRHNVRVYSEMSLFSLSSIKSWLIIVLQYHYLDIKKRQTERTPQTAV